MKTLREVPCGQRVKVRRLAGDGPVKRRIMDMGITKGVEIFAEGRYRNDRSRVSFRVVYFFAL